MYSNELRHESRSRLLEAALQVIRAKGYSATRIEDICEGAGLTKGSFFHHFKSKEELAIAAAEYWGDTTSAFFASAPYHALPDPLDRVLAYVDLRKAMLQGGLPDFTCPAGTMVQEVYDTHPEIRAACNKSISNHAASLQPDIEAAMRQCRIGANWTAESLALYIQATIQGAFVLAKAKHNSRFAADCLGHLRHYLEMLFNRPQAKKGNSMNLTEEPEIVIWPETHYVFVEKTGPFMTTAPQAWQTAHTHVPAISKHNQITGYMSLYKVGPEIYRAGFALAAPPVELPQGLQYLEFLGGKYSRFVLTGPYSDLPKASGRVLEIVSEKQIPIREGFCIENYVNDPGTTPEEQLVTEILIPTI
jgi:TetR/AcrR family transcriptional repressor of nem operon